MPDSAREPVNLPPMTRRARLALLFGQQAQLPWVVSALLLPFAVMNLPALHKDYYAFRQPTVTVPGRIVGVVEEQRRERVGRYSHRVTVYLHTYSYEADGFPRKGEYEGRRRLDDDIMVEYVVGRPGICRIAGVESGVFYFVLALFALASFAVSIGVTWRRWRNLNGLAWRIHDDLSRPPPYRSYGRYPKVRMNRDGMLVVWGSEWLMVWPAIATVCAAIVLDHVLF